MEYYNGDSINYKMSSCGEIFCHPPFQGVVHLIGAPHDVCVFNLIELHHLLF